VGAYFFFAPELFAFVFTKNGKPLKNDNSIPAESERISFLVDGIESYVKDGEDLYSLYGWALITPENNESEEKFVREIVLISDERKYFFPVNSVYRNPGLPSEYVNMEIGLGTLGFNALIAEDVIKPGKYRIGIVFRNTSTDGAFYSDKPARYIVRTPNTFSLDK
jgi:hypothetical protein